MRERLATLEGPPAPGPVDAGARRRLETWRRQEPFGHGDWWARRLKELGLDEAGLLGLLGDPPAGVEAPTPAWATEVEEAYARPVAEPVDWPPPEPGTPRVPFLSLVEPLVRRAHARLRAGLTALKARFPEAPFTPEAATLLLGHLPLRLAPVLGRALVVELHAAQLDGPLAGGTPEARFETFEHSLRQRAVALDILERYPVLARSAVERVAQWEDASLELMRRLAEDAAGLRERIHGDGDPGLLVEARGGLSDPHRGGRGVCVLRFASGARLVYKPRSLGPESVFQRLLTWVNARGATPSLATVRVWDRGDYGWMEHVDAAPCATSEEVRRFYARQGAYVALLHVLDATDCHCENIIAAGEHPFLVDLETLFHPLSGTRRPRAAEHDQGVAFLSVLRSGLLPQRFWSTREGGGIDLSGLGARPGQKTSQAFLVSAGRGTDQMRYERQPVEMARTQNLPTLQGADVAVLEHRDALAEGFSRMYALLRAHRAQLLAPEGPLAAFADVPMRVLFRNTAVYGTLYFESFHPHVLADAAERQRFLDQLWRSVVTVPDLELLVPLEQRALERADIPYFSARPGSRDLESCQGERLPGFFAESGLERVRRRVEGLSEDDHARQRWVLERSLDVLWLGSTVADRPSYAFQETSLPASREALLEAARGVGRRLLTLAFEGRDEARWLSLFAGEGGWQLAQPGTDVFQGLAGIALSLGYLGEATGDAAFTRVARRAVVALVNVCEENPRGTRGLGILNGWGGILYALTHLGVLWGDDALLDQAVAYTARLAPLVAEDTVLDVGAGSAGCLLAFLGLEAHRPSASLRQLMQACGDRLAATAHPREQGVAWLSEAAGNQYLVGFAHGVAGTALALLQLAAAVGDPRPRELALRALEYERALYSARERNWPDLRARPVELGGDGEHFMWAWCTGAPGVGLARVRGLPLLDDARVRDEIAVAIDSTLARGFGRNHSLCHGDLGNVDFLLEAARALGDASLEQRARRVAGGILRGLQEHGPLHGLQGNAETPGLMVGLAGMAYQLARLALPDSLPSLLAVAPPPPRGRR
ncbi:type 2 lantipeptide synthetase LanM family protein [Myxococcus stipitatus]|uniref:type 2 lanthipeptide synthetase LanM family protein n=1 Tax=Myxococcus stipitatus TaxID=83455 RepID=UPI001F41BD9B|nr:type 2 lanthipeptide synthetase LanM family protein [Myxococcus stipitatus]MCE9667131.1 type 2 lantipeptide synthetase LanM family protein [Myxococcus stipitatus]